MLNWHCPSCSFANINGRPASTAFLCGICCSAVPSCSAAVMLICHASFSLYIMTACSLSQRHLRVYASITIRHVLAINEQISMVAMHRWVECDCRAACAVMGFVGTWVGQALIGGIGLLRTGVCALLLQAGSLALAAVIYRCACPVHLHMPAVLQNACP